MRAVHLVKRFAGALRPGGPSVATEVWVEDRLLDGERPLWRRMPAPDRRHAAGVAHRVQAALGPDATRAVVAAALLHDVGKIDSGLGTFRRVGATLAAPLVRADWPERGGVRRRVARYRDHPRIGADMLARAGSDPLTVAWAGEHHLPPSAWTLPRPLAEALRAADDD